MIEGDPLPPGAERNVFGANSTYHPITGMPLETGIGAAPHHVQAQHHCNVIEQREGKEAADAMRAKLHEAANPKPKLVAEPGLTDFDPRRPGFDPRPGRIMPKPQPDPAEEE